MRNTLERNGEQVIKNAGTGDKECWNRWETIRKQVRKAGRTCYGNGTNYLLSLVNSFTRQLVPTRVLSLFILLFMRFTLPL